MRRALAYFRCPLFLIWDHLAAHRSCEVQAHLAAHLADFTQYWLPGYAPELNPEEQRNRWAKRRLENATPMSDEALRAGARCAFRQNSSRPRRRTVVRWSQSRLMVPWLAVAHGWGT